MSSPSQNKPAGRQTQVSPMQRMVALASSTVPETPTEEINIAVPTTTEHNATAAPVTAASSSAQKSLPTPPIPPRGQGKKIRRPAPFKNLSDSSRSNGNGDVIENGPQAATGSSRWRLGRPSPKSPSVSPLPMSYTPTSDGEHTVSPVVETHTHTSIEETLDRQQTLPAATYQPPMPQTPANAAARPSAKRANSSEIRASRQRASRDSAHWLGLPKALRPAPDRIPTIQPEQPSETSQANEDNNNNGLSVPVTSDNARPKPKRPRSALRTKASRMTQQHPSMARIEEEDASERRVGFATPPLPQPAAARPALARGVSSYMSSLSYYFGGSKAPVEEQLPTQAQSPSTTERPDAPRQELPQRPQLAKARRTFGFKSSSGAVRPAAPRRPTKGPPRRPSAHGRNQTQSRWSEFVTAGFAPPMAAGIPGSTNPLWLPFDRRTSQEGHSFRRDRAGIEMTQQRRRPSMPRNDSGGMPFASAGAMPARGEMENSFDSDNTLVGSDGSFDDERKVKGDSGDSTSDLGKTDEDDEDDESGYPTGMRKYLLMLGLALATLVTALDNTIIATAIPVIATQFNAIDDVGWFGSAYLLTMTSLQPSFGRVYTLFNVKWTYICSILLFEVGSVVCGAANGALMLIIGRAIAGVAAAGLSSGSLNIIGYAVPPRQKPIFVGLSACIFGVSGVLGPLLGGVFTDTISWRWCFYINLPVGLIAAAAVFFFFKNPEREKSKLGWKAKLYSLDLLGAISLIACVVLLLLALAQGGTSMAWSNPEIYGCLIGSAVLFIFFVGWQFYMGEMATLPPRIVSQRSVAFSSMIGLFFNIAFFSHIYYLPFYFQVVKNATAEKSGLDTIPYLVADSVAAIAVGGGIFLVGYFAPFAFVGSALFTVGAGLLYTLGVHTSTAASLGYQVVAGLGAGACLQIPIVAVQVVLDVEDLPTGNAIAIFFSTLGGAIGVSVAESVFDNTLKSAIPSDVPGVSAAVLMAAGPTKVRDIVSSAQLPGVLDAYSTAIQTTFLMCLVSASLCFLCSFGLEWRSAKGKKMELGGPA